MNSEGEDDDNQSHSLLHNRRGFDVGEVNVCVGQCESSYGFPMWLIPFFRCMGRSSRTPKQGKVTVMPIPIVHRDACDTPLVAVDPHLPLEHSQPFPMANNSERNLRRVGVCTHVPSRLNALNRQTDFYVKVARRYANWPQTCCDLSPSFHLSFPRARRRTMVRGPCRFSPDSRRSLRPDAD